MRMALLIVYESRTKGRVIRGKLLVKWIDKGTGKRVGRHRMERSES